MKNFLFVSLLGLALCSCESENPDVCKTAGDKLIYEGVSLQPSTWEKLELDSSMYLSFGDISFYNENFGILDGFGGYVYITRDGGENWYSKRILSYMTFHCVYALNEKTYFAARYGIFKSVNGGVSWRTCNFSKEISVFNIWFKDSLNGFLSSSDGTYKSTDAGNHWKKISVHDASDLQFTSKNVGYFCYGSTPVTKSDDPFQSHGDICRTTNGGITWRKMGLDVKQIIRISFISDKTGFFITVYGELYKTTDGAESCTLVDVKDYGISDLFFINENQGLFCTADGIYITLDGGYTLQLEYPTTYFNSVRQFEFPSPAVGYAIGHNGLVLKRKAGEP